MSSNNDQHPVLMTVRMLAARRRLAQIPVNSMIRATGSGSASNRVHAQAVTIGGQWYGVVYLTSFVSRGHVVSLCCPYAIGHVKSVNALAEQQALSSWRQLGHQTCCNQMLQLVQWHCPVAMTSVLMHL